MAGFRYALTLGGSLVFALACPSDDGSDDAADDSSTSATQTTTASTTDSTTASTTASTSASTTESPTTSTTDPTVSTTATSTDTDPTDTDPTDTTTDTGGGCESCDAGEYCDWALNGCGTSRFDEVVCTPIPDGCPAVEEDPVCGCDGVVYSGACAAALLGVDVDVEGDCTAPAGTFQCGYGFCDPTTSYCQRSVSDIGGYPDGWSCVDLPAGCSETPDCACLADEPCAFDCSETKDGGLLLTCPGG